MLTAETVSNILLYGKTKARHIPISEWHGYIPSIIHQTSCGTDAVVICIDAVVYCTDAAVNNTDVAVTTDLGARGNVHSVISLCHQY